MENKKCNHEWEEKENKLICKHCGKYELLLRETGQEGLKVGTKDDGTKYSVRDTRNRYFYPYEWKDFMSNVSDKNKIIFETLIITGARIQEAMMIKKSHIKIDKKYLILYTTKIKARKQERKSKSRDISLSKHFIRKIKAYMASVKDSDYIFLDNNKCNGLTEKEIKKIAHKKSLNVYQIFKRAMVKTEIEDVYNFSLHNIRKTCGMWLKALNVKESEICLRLGHNMNTYLEHYSSSDIFNQSQRQEMINILGDIYGLK